MSERNLFDKMEEFLKLRDELVDLSEKFDEVGIPYIWITGVQNDGEETKFSIIGNSIGEATPTKLLFFKLLLDNGKLLNFVIENFPVIILALKTGHSMADKISLPELDIMLKVSDEYRNINVDSLQDDNNIPDEFADWLNKMDDKDK